MICRNCLKELEPGAAFCPVCGSKVTDMLNSEKKSAAVSDVFGSTVTDTAEPVSPVITPAPAAAPTPAAAPGPTPVQQAAPSAQTVHNSAQMQAPVYDGGLKMKDVPQPRAAAKKEKEFFGKGAFVFCLIVIALLAGTSGAFAYLYFSLLGTI